LAIGHKYKFYFPQKIITELFCPKERKVRYTGTIFTGVYVLSSKEQTNAKCVFNDWNDETEKGGLSVINHTLRELKEYL